MRKLTALLAASILVLTAGSALAAVIPSIPGQHLLNLVQQNPPPSSADQCGGLAKKYNKYAPTGPLRLVRVAWKIDLADCVGSAAPNGHRMEVNGIWFRANTTPSF